MFKSNDGAFRIMQLTDIHIGEYPFSSEDEKTFSALTHAVQAEKPDLIMITGDLLWTDGVKEPEHGYRALIDLFNRLNYPIAVTYGNHDSEETLTRSSLRQLEKGFNHRVEKMNVFVDHQDKECYTLEVGTKNDIQHVLYVFDSGDNSPLVDLEGYDWVSPEQIDWYERTHQQYLQNVGQTVDLVFLHIPLPEYKNAGEHILTGQFWEQNPRVAAPQLNTGLFSRIRYNQHVAGIFCGHDHDNNFDGTFMGTHLIYGNVSGYNCYGVLPRGYRLITLDEDGMRTQTVPYQASL